MCVVNTTPRPLHPLGKTRYPLYRRLGGPQCRCGRVRKMSPPPAFDPRTVKRVASPYTEYLIPALCNFRISTVKLTVNLSLSMPWRHGGGGSIVFVTSALNGGENSSDGRKWKYIHLHNEKPYDIVEVNNFLVHSVLRHRLHHLPRFLFCTWHWSQWILTNTIMSLRWT